MKRRFPASLRESSTISNTLTGGPLALLDRLELVNWARHALGGVDPSASQRDQHLRRKTLFRLKNPFQAIFRRFVIYSCFGTVRNGQLTRLSRSIPAEFLDSVPFLAEGSSQLAVSEEEPHQDFLHPSSEEMDLTRKLLPEIAERQVSLQQRSLPTRCQDAHGTTKLEDEIQTKSPEEAHENRKW